MTEGIKHTMVNMGAMGGGTEAFCGDRLKVEYGYFKSEFDMN